MLAGQQLLRFRASTGLFIGTQALPRHSSAVSLSTSKTQVPGGFKVGTPTAMASSSSPPAQLETATFGMGCFWSPVSLSWPVTS